MTETHLCVCLFFSIIGVSAAVEVRLGVIDTANECEEKKLMVVKVDHGFRPTPDFEE
ncbi:hypothetical protein M569_00784 [Genlisea aurea]|uniref:Uncharacterized protein n=1 Tax=Genlisea aurea TaxID=192259 RepID=S8D973_9LAMI|nr:hypothetical protein M569_00784 [Genlisea aurea]